MTLPDPYVHAWVIPADVAIPVWESLQADAIAVLTAASHRLERSRRNDELAMLRGPEGFGHLLLRPDRIAFNGNAFLGQAGEPFALERHARSHVIARQSIEGERRTVRRCSTHGYPYDLAVCAVLLVAERHLGTLARVGTSGSLRTGWSRAAELVRDTLGGGRQLVQHENGVLHWVDALAPESHGSERSSAS